MSERRGALTMRIGISELGTAVGGRTGRWVADAAASSKLWGSIRRGFSDAHVFADDSHAVHPYGGDREVAALRRAGLYDPVVSATAAAMQPHGCDSAHSSISWRFVIQPATAAGIATLDQIWEVRAVRRRRWVVPAGSMTC